MDVTGETKEISGVEDTMETGVRIMKGKENYCKVILTQSILSIVIVFVLVGCGKDSTRGEEIITSNMEKEEYRKENKDLQELLTLFSLFESALADVKAEDAVITIRGDSPSLSQASLSGKDAKKVLGAMIELVGNIEIKLSSGVGLGQDIVCYFDLENSKCAVYVAKHDDSVGGDEILAHDGVPVQNCKYNDNVPLMASN